MQKRKKKILLSLLTLMTSAGLVLSGCGKSEEPTDTAQVYLDEPVEVTPSEEFADDSVAEVTDGVGEVAVLPWGTAETAAMAGTNTVTFYFKNPDILLGSGNVAVVNTNDPTILSSVSVTDPGVAEQTPMNPDECSLFGWTEGQKVSIYFDSCFLPGQSYSVRADEGCFIAGSSLSKPITDDSVTFTTKMYGLNVSSLPNTVREGDTLKIPVVLGSGASMAKAEMVSNCTILHTSFTENGTLSVSFDSPGAASFTMKFSSPDGTVLDTMPLIFTVQ